MQGTERPVVYLLRTADDGSIIDMIRLDRFVHGRIALAAFACDAGFIDHASSGIFLLDDA